MTYLITFACYGARLHGEESGSVDRHHNLYAGRLAEPSAERVALKRHQMDQAAYLLDAERRAIALEAFREMCEERGWLLWPLT